MSKLMVFEFCCKEHGKFDDLVCPSDKKAACPVCQKKSKRVMSAPRIDRLRIAGSGSASPESIAYFDRVHKQQRDKEARAMREHGDYGPAPGASR